MSGEKHTRKKAVRQHKAQLSFEKNLYAQREKKSNIKNKEHFEIKENTHESLVQPIYEKHKQAGEIQWIYV